jgi:hypothetical protein
LDSSLAKQEEEYITLLEFVVGKRRFLTTKILRKGSLEHPNLAKSKEREGEDEGERGRCLDGFFFSSLADATW